MDLNLLTNYKNFTKGATIQQQLDKVEEEMLEFENATLYETEEKQIEEALDVMTALYNYLFMLGITEEHFYKHIKKLDEYVKNNKYGGVDEN